MVIVAVLLLAQAGALRCPSGGLQEQIIACAEHDAKRADIELNRQWTLTVKAIREMDASAKDAPRPYVPTAYADLLKAQRAWLVFRDAECASEAHRNDGGVDGPVTAAQCAERLTKERVRQLQELAEEG